MPNGSNADSVSTERSIAPDRHVEKAMRIPDITADPVTVLRVWIKSRQKVEIFPFIGMKQADLFHPFFMFRTVKKVDFYRIFAV